MHIQKTGLTLLMILCISAVFSQTQFQNDFFSLKNFTPPSPEAAAMARFGDIPANPSTGVPQISVPIYEIKSGKLIMPISISYHASGIKVQDLPTPVGLGWVLNAGGEISRTIIGIPDEQSGGLLNLDSTYYKTRAQLENQRYNGTICDHLNGLAHGTYDTQSDAYYYSAGDLSGKFEYDTKKNMHVTPLDRQPKIVWNADSTFTITDDGGNKYYYACKEHTQNSANTFFYLTTWHLTKIISADRGDSIKFYYRLAASYSDTTKNHAYTILVPNDETYVMCANGTPNISFNENTNIMVHERNLIDSISFSNGYVKFVYSDDREDILPEKLSMVRIANTDGIIKEVAFKYSYFLTNTGGGSNNKFEKRLRLDSLKFNDKNSQNINNYTFEYSNHTLPSYRTAVGYVNNYSDYWGYYNGTTYSVNGITGLSNTTLPSSYIGKVKSFLEYNYGGADNAYLTAYQQRSMVKYANPDVMDGCILQKINYPTGGFTAFGYEANRINDSGDSASYRGGLRVHTIASFDTMNRKPVVKTYRYDSAVSVSKEYATDFAYTTTNIVIESTWNIVHKCNKQDFHISTNPINALGTFNGSPVIYQQVTEFNGFPGMNAGKTVYQYDSDADSLYNDPDSYKYTNYATDKGWGRGNLLNKKIYKTENDSSILIKEYKNYYTPYAQGTIKVGQVCDRMIGKQGSYTDDLADYMNADTVLLGSSYAFVLIYYEYFDILQSYALKKLTKTEEIDYLNHNIISTREYAYGGTNHLYPVKTLGYTSKTADTLIEKTKYPQDRTNISGLSSESSNAYDSMVVYNVKAVPVESEQYRNNQLLFRNRTTYKDWNNSKRFYEEYKYTQKGSDSLEPRLQYKQYDTSGNPTRMSQYGGTDIAYVWSYNNAYPTAKAINAADNEIDYTSFESNESGNWTISNSGRVSRGITGVKSFNLSGSASVFKGGLTNGKYYIVSYWSTGASATVNSGSGTSKGTKNGWTLYEHRLSNSTTSVTITGSVVIDELKLYPEDALINTYTYKPLVGMVASTSPNDLITTYEYDDFARLKTIRDNDSNIVKTIDYKYNQAQGTGVSGWNVTTSLSGGHYSHEDSLFYFSYAPFVSRTERDFNSSSATYNLMRYVPYALGANQNQWVTTGSSYCLKNGSDENTGYQMVEYVDTNRYSIQYLKKKWEKVYNATSCPIPCESMGPAYKTVSGNCEYSIRHYTVSYYDSGLGKWVCVYHYEWSDSSESDDFTEYTDSDCLESGE